MKRTLFPFPQKNWWAIRNKGKIFINFNIAWRWLTSDVYRTERGFWGKKKKKVLHPFYFIHAFMHKSRDSWNRSLNWEHNLLHRSSSCKKRRPSCFVGAIQCGRNWYESASSFWGGLVVHQELERKLGCSVLLFIQYRDSLHLPAYQEESFPLPS